MMEHALAERATPVARVFPICLRFKCRMRPPFPYRQPMAAEAVPGPRDTITAPRTACPSPRYAATAVGVTVAPLRDLSIAE
jgi:hypothetical protein